VAVKMDKIVRTRSENAASDNPNSWLDAKNDTLKVDVGVIVDHILVLSASYPSFFANLGMGGFDIRSNDKHVLRDSEPLSALRLGNVVMLLPIVNGGFNIGTKLQLRVEADILPLPVVRSGVNYYF